MGVDSKHPFYNDRTPDWKQMRDTFKGERTVKEAGIEYLSPTAGMVADGMVRVEDRGFQAYDAYRRRARVPDLVKEAVKALIGVMHNKPAAIELPAVMEPLIERATLNNESMQMLLRRINQGQLVLGRVGLVGDFIDSTPLEAGTPANTRAGEPYIAIYDGDLIINWDDGTQEEVAVDNLNLVVIDESEDERVTDFEWQRVNKYRVLSLGELKTNEPEGAPGANYAVGVFRETTGFSEANMAQPVFKGKAAEEIPFVFINSSDVVSTPDDPPLLGLSNLVLGIYRGEADYRQSLFMQGQDTLVTIGGPDETESLRTGAGARINIPSVEGDAKFIGVESGGLSEQRSALENDHNRGMQTAGQLLDSVSRERESGDALKVRVAARTATLNQIALAGAFGLETLLKKIARWMGANDEEVVVTPNLDFVDDEMTGEELAQLMGAKMLKAPLSMESIHKVMQDKGMTEKTLEEELEAIVKERETVLFEPEPGSENPDDLEDDDDEPGGGGGNNPNDDGGGGSGGDGE